ncbi:FKBP-type peptidyl-prolyl cis-trans isomerase N-terminal domain-containing protein [Serratia liquefaciens]|jgi:FKBP-type peptidyl-prolyl cis-trans isomerase|uniref:FKBP-type peptidyl-prolyl cis-trans isomerase N-terminal domain-containing protein n=1 Tax=Serratia liquefaciens TaxID=614 RepID=UPI00381775F8
MMTTRYRLLIGLLLPLYGSGVFANDGIPGLLLFAEKYQENRPPADALPGNPSSVKTGSDTIPKAKPAKNKAPVRATSDTKKPVTTRPATDSAATPLKKTLQAQAAQLKAQQATIVQLEKQLNVPVPDASAWLGQLAQRVRQALAITPAEQAAVAQFRLLREREADITAQLAAVKKDNAGLQAQLRSLARDGEGAGKTYLQAVEKQQQLQNALVGVKQVLGARDAALAEKEQALSAAQQELASMKKALQVREAEKVQAVTAQTAVQQKMDTLTVEHAALRTQLKEREKTHEVVSAQRDEADRARKALGVKLTTELQRGEQLQIDIVALRERAKWLATPQTLKTNAGSQAYAAGVSLGRDILDMLEERKGWGVKAERKTVLAGIVDAFAGQYQLTTDVLARALAESETAVNLARDKAGAAQQKLDEKFMSDFKKMQGVVQSASGFWYQINYAGDDPITADAIVDLVVKESLTDGTVIQDMDSAGNVLSQPLSAYPPLFKEALGHLRNHGTLTMVVPPELAYGEAGYPPKIPPNATMIYELRVVDIKP